MKRGYHTYSPQTVPLTIILGALCEDSDPYTAIRQPIPEAYKCEVVRRTEHFCARITVLHSL